AYEAFGTRTEEDGTNVERQKANTKDEDPWGGLNEGMRYRDLEFGIFITRDPMGFVDGPNVYTYVRQNPWSAFDPLGLARKDADGFEWKGKGHHKVPAQVARDAGWHKDAKKVFDKATLKAPSHGSKAHGKVNGYNAEVGAEMANFLENNGGLEGKSAKQQKRLAERFVRNIDETDNKFIKGFNKNVGGGKGAITKWFNTDGKNIVLKATGELPGTRNAKVINGIAKTVKIGGKLAKGVPIVAGVVAFGSSIAEGKSIDDASIDVVMSITGADILADSVNSYVEEAHKKIYTNRFQKLEDNGVDVFGFGE
ncbi:MAG: RHS repeat-associated core domain-containing protein, partial [Bacteroidota bacterium]